MKRRGQWGLPGGSTDYSAAQVRPKEDVRDSEVIRAPMTRWKYQNKILLLHLRKIQGKTGQSLSLNIFGKWEGERGCFFSISQSWQTRHQKAPAHAPQSSLLWPLLSHLWAFSKAQSHSVFSLCLTLFLQWASWLIIRKKKQPTFLKYGKGRLLSRW